MAMFGCRTTAVHPDVGQADNLGWVGRTRRQAGRALVADSPNPQALAPESAMYE